MWYNILEINGRKRYVMTNKIRVYIDTSIISYLDQQDMPDRMRETQEMWKILKTGKYQVLISNLVLGEISECSDKKRDHCSVSVQVDNRPIHCSKIGLSIISFRHFRKKLLLWWITPRSIARSSYTVLPQSTAAPWFSCRPIPLTSIQSNTSGLVETYFGENTFSLWLSWTSDFCCYDTLKPWWLPIALQTSKPRNL